MSNKISFDKAQKALSHFQSKPTPTGKEEKTPLLEVTGWDKTEIVYSIKAGIESAFSKQIKRTKDIGQQINKYRQKEKLTKEDRKKIQELNDEYSEIMDSEEELTLSKKLTKKQFGNIITGEMRIDLDFAIEVEQDQEKEES